jgi:hypothetical protein
MMRFADMSRYVNGGQAYIYIVKKWRDDGGGKTEAGTGGKRGKKIGGNAMARQTFSTGW